MSRAKPVGLVELAKEGDSSAFRALFEAHAKSIYSLTLRIAGDALDAETLTRDIFLAAFANLNSIADDGAFSVELTRQSAKRVLARHFRRGGKDPRGQHLTLNQHLTASEQKDLPTDSE